jgi:hypothetical protein
VRVIAAIHLAFIASSAHVAGHPGEDDEEADKQNHASDADPCAGDGLRSNRKSG